MKRLELETAIHYLLEVQQWNYLKNSMKKVLVLLEKRLQKVYFPYPAFQRKNGYA